MEIPCPFLPFLGTVTESNGAALLLNMTHTGALDCWMRIPLLKKAACSLGCPFLTNNEAGSVMGQTVTTPRFMPRSPTPGPPKMTVFGDGVFTEVINLK